MTQDIDKQASFARALSHAQDHLKKNQPANQPLAKKAPTSSVQLTDIEWAHSAVIRQAQHAA